MREQDSFIYCFETADLAGLTGRKEKIMVVSNNMRIEMNFIQRILSAISGRKCAVLNNDTKKEAAGAVNQEIDTLWELVREKNENKSIISEECYRARISESFSKTCKLFSDEQVDNIYTWPRYVKVAVNIVAEPIDELINHVNEKNYIFLTKQLSVLSHSVYKDGEESVKNNMERFKRAVYLHILQTIDHNDVPSCLSLGKMELRKGCYEKAREWYSRILETDNPFNGVTAILSSYEEEVRGILVNKPGTDQEAFERVRKLNCIQSDLYEKWITDTKNDLSSGKVTEQSKIQFVSLMTSYAGFERNRGHFDKAFEILKSIPESYPEIYRVYAEEGMLYQFKPSKNNYYNLEKAITAFRKAEKAINDSSKGRAHDVKSKKTVLMPLANTYFQSGMYEEAMQVCESVLRIDSKEIRAIKLKERITKLAS